MSAESSMNVAGVIEKTTERSTEGIEALKRAWDESMRLLEIEINKDRTMDQEMFDWFRGLSAQFTLPAGRCFQAYGPDRYNRWQELASYAENCLKENSAWTEEIERFRREAQELHELGRPSEEHQSAVDSAEGE